MTAPHFFAEDLAGDHVVLPDDEARHARRSLRLHVGEPVTIGDGAGTVVDGRVEEVGDAVSVAVLARRTVARPRPVVVVYPAVPKGDKLELVVQKLTEIGVDAIRPWFAERTVVRWDEAKARAHGERLRAVAREAAKQSKREWLPEVAMPGPLGALPALTVVPHEEAENPLRDALPPDVDQVGIVIGPEGGLSAEEVERLRAAGARPVSLGPQILRAETASIVAATLVLTRYGRIG